MSFAVGQSIRCTDNAGIHALGLLEKDAVYEVRALSVGKCFVYIDVVNPECGHWHSNRFEAVEETE